MCHSFQKDRAALSMRSQSKINNTEDSKNEIFELLQSSSALHYGQGHILWCNFFSLMLQYKLGCSAEYVGSPKLKLLLFPKKKVDERAKNWTIF